MTQLPGGWQDADIRSSRVHEAALFACRHTFGARFVSYIMIYAEQQVVAGMNYNIILNVSTRNAENGNNIIEHQRRFVVNDHFGQYSVIQQST
jgi:hypothetical protein